MNKTGILLTKMCNYYDGDIKRINHFMKVYAFAKAIGESENLDERTMYILETAAAVHDIGIKISEQKYNSAAGNYQELEGPPEAEKMLSELGYESDIIKRVCFLIGHHHTYENIDGIDYQILIESDFLVNIDEDNMFNSIKSIDEKIFKTESGKRIMRNLFGK